MGTEAEVRGYVKPPTFLEQGFLFLKRDVLNNRTCCLCGTCAAFCDKIKIKFRSKSFYATVICIR